MNYNEVNVKKANALNKRIKINLHDYEIPHEAFEIIQTGEIRKTIPLFYFDEIIVNDNCRQIDNKIILSTDDISVSETFYKSYDTITDFKIKYDLQRINNELFFKAHFIDQNYNKISNKNVKIIFESNNNNNIETKTLRTTNDGNIIYHFPVILENMSLKIIIDDIERMVNI